MKVFYESDADLTFIKNCTVAIIGYGSQGHAHAKNLRDSGVKVVIGLYHSSTSWSKAKSEGFEVKEVAQAVQGADLIMLLLPDEKQPEIYHTHIAPHLKSGATLAFAHGFNIHFGLINPPPDIDVIMVAPKGPGLLVRSAYKKGRGVPSFIAVHQNYSGKAHHLALSYAAANGSARMAVIETSFREETETDLFSEQAVLCGGTAELVKAGFETLVEAGYAPEVAYLECVYELKQIVDLLYEGGLAYMNHAISNNAEYGEYVAGPKVVNETTKQAMRAILKAIQNGQYAKSFLLENLVGMPTLVTHRRLNAEHLLEKTGQQIRQILSQPKEPS